MGYAVAGGGEPGLAAAGFVGAGVSAIEGVAAAAAAGRPATGQGELTT